MVSVQARKEQASYAINWGVSQRRTCTLLSIGRSSLYYSHKMPVKDEPVIEAMIKLSGIYPRFGYRPIQIFLQRDGIHLGKDRCGRLWTKQAYKYLKNAVENEVGLLAI